MMNKGIDISERSTIDKDTKDKGSSLQTSVDIGNVTDTDSDRPVRLATSGSFVARPNQVSTVMLHGVPIVCLYIDGRERLCLAQISNTLLKQYSYNEIHNRRVALGITCVQCTPVQLEILRRAGAMPISSRRCGMITMREAQRLVKSFLEDNTPPKLPDNFSFHVKHLCGWGCDGNFEPSRYNSSRAKCIKCTLCNMYFSPNKFIFHFHRTPESKYNHPDAANFNSWRRHLHLASGNENENVVHAWEDVKAMFNGGSRKRIISTTKSHYEPAVSEPSIAKKARIASPEYEMTEKMYSSPYSALSLLSQPRKHFQFSQLSPSHPLGFGLPYPKDCPSDSSKQSPFTAPSWAGLHSMLPAYNLLWNNPFSHDYSSPMRSSVFPIREPLNSDTLQDEDSSSSAGNSPTYDEKNERFSAFRLVSKSKAIEDKTFIADNNQEDHVDETEEVDITDEDSLKDPIQANCDDKADSSKEKTMTPPSEVNRKHAECVTCVAKVKHGIQQVLEKSTEKVKSTRLCYKEEDTTGNLADTQHQRKVKSSADFNVANMTKEEIQTQIKMELDIRKKMEQEIQTLKDSLTTELEQERQVRYSLQQKLKEAHDALHNFSCKMLASRQCDECAYKDDEESPQPDRG